MNVNDLWGHPTPGKEDTADEKGEPKSRNNGGLFKRRERGRTSESFACLPYSPKELVLSKSILVGEKVFGKNLCRDRLLKSASALL